jgi:DNA polymerase III sliding clamp (beta) subunit (PCNA family)
MKSEITLPVPELKTALSGLNKLVGKRTALPVLSHVRVTRKPSGLVTLQGTDLDAFATFTLHNPQPGEVVDVLVPLEQLNQAFKCSTSKQDVVLVSEGKTTKLRYCIGGSPVHQPVNPLPIGEWPILPPITAESTLLQPGFGEALKQAMACCSEDSSRHVLRGACLDARDEKAHYVVSTNGQFLYSANSFTFPLQDAIIIPDSKFLTGSGLLDGEPCFLAVQPGNKPSARKHISLQNQQWQFVTREIEGNYPNWKQHLPSVNGSWTLVQLSPSAIEQLLAVIPNLPGRDGNTNTIRLRTGNQCLWVEGRHREDAEWTKIAIPEVNLTGKAKVIALNRDYLLPALKFGLNELQILDELSPMACRKAGKCVVIMPVNLKGPQTNPPTAAAPSAAPESQPQPQPQTERKTDMTKAITKSEGPKPPDQPSLLDQIEEIKDTLKNAIRDLNGLTDVVKQTEKDQRASEKEVDAARSVLKKLQQVSL